jgi:hypothetical protein
VKVISKFKDYYDPVGRTDREDRPLYLRHTSGEQTVDAQMMPAFARVRDVLAQLPAPQVGDAAIVGFCGRAYPVLLLPEPCWTLDEYERGLRDRLAGPGLDGWGRQQLEHALELLHARRARPHSPWLNLRSWRRFLDEARFEVSDEAFRQLRAPVFLLTEGYGRLHVVANPRLAPLRFASQVDPYQAWQSLDVYLGNNLSDLRQDAPEPADELKAHYHGYDEWSFRRRPGTKGRRKRDDD